MSMFNEVFKLCKVQYVMFKPSLKIKCTKPAKIYIYLCMTKTNLHIMHCCTSHAVQVSAIESA